MRAPWWLLGWILTGCTAILGIGEPGATGDDDADGGVGPDASAAFTISVDPPLRARRDGTTFVVVRVERDAGATGPIQVSLLDLPPTITSPVATIEAGADMTNLQIMVLADETLGPIQVRLHGASAGQVVDVPTTLMIADPPGALDVSFSDDGRIDLFVGGFSEAKAVAVQPDGKILVAGDGGRVVRLNTDGTTDTSFGDDGVLTTGDLGLFGVGLHGTDVFTAANNFDGTQIMEVRHFDQDGAPDATFATDGTAGFPGFAQGQVFAVDSAGNTLVAGSGSSGTRMARFLADGKRDDNFGTLGTFAPPSMATMLGFEVRPDLSLVVVGHVNNGVSEGVALTSTNLNGVVVPGFGGGDGLATVGTFREAGTHLDFAPDGKFVVAGQSNMGDLVFRKVVVASFLPNGTPDSMFNGGEGVLVMAPTTTGEEARGVQVQADGKIVVAMVRNFARMTGPKIASQVVRLLPGGATDESFPAVVIGDQNAFDVQIYAMALQPDGRIIVVGGTETGWLVLRVWD